jgi:transposase
MGVAARVWHHRCCRQPMERPVKRNDLSRSLVAFEQDSTLIAVIELSLKTWLVAGLAPGIERNLLQRRDPDPDGLLALLHRWRAEALKAGREVDRIVVAYEAGRDGFWLARWLRERGIESYVIHPTSIAVSREHRRAKSDRLDTQLLMRSLLGWLRGEVKHCSMAAIPALAEEDARRPNREHETLVGERSRIINRMKATMVRFGIRGFKVTLRKAAGELPELLTAEGVPLPPNTLAELRREMARLHLIREQIKAIEQARLVRLRKAPQTGTHPMVLMLARVLGVGVETADTLVHEALSRNLRDEKAIGRYAGLTGAPDESGSKRREKGLARAGNARVRRTMIQLAWRWLMFQKDSALAQWYRERTASARGDIRKTMIVALARKLLIALWRYVTAGEVPTGARLKPVAL